MWWAWGNPDLGCPPMLQKDLLGAILLSLLLSACTTKLPDGTAGGGSSGGGGGGNGRIDLVGTVYNAETLQPQSGVMVQSGTNFAYSQMDGSYEITVNGNEHIKFFDDVVYPAEVGIPAGQGIIFRDISVVPLPSSGGLFGANSAIITNRYLAGLEVGDEMKFQEDGLLSGSEVHFRVVNKEYNHGIWALRIRWGEDEWANHFVIAEDIYGNVRLLEYNSVAVDMNHPPILLPEVATIGQVLTDFWGQQCYVVETTAVIAPSAFLGITENLQQCLQTSVFGSDLEEIWAPGFGLAATQKVGLGNKYYKPTEGTLRGQRLGGEPANFNPDSTTISNQFLPGLAVDDFFVWEGTGDNVGGTRKQTVVDSVVMPTTGIPALVLSTVENYVPVETMWVAQDTDGNLRILQEVEGISTTTYAWERAPILCPSEAIEGMHLGIRSNGGSQEIEHVEVEFTSNYGFGYFANLHEVEVDIDAGLEKIEYLWTPGFGQLQVIESTTAGWELSGGRLAGLDF